LKNNILVSNTDSKLLFTLFKDFTDRLVKNTESLGIFAVDEGEPIFTDNDIKKVIEEMKTFD